MKIPKKGKKDFSEMKEKTGRKEVKSEDKSKKKKETKDIKKVKDRNKEIKDIKHGKDRNSSNENKEIKVSKKAKDPNICPIDEKCGGCDFQGVPYEEQLQIKQKEVRKLIDGFCKVLPIVRMENPYHYRNKVHAVFSRLKNGTIISGTYKEKSHIVVNVDSCQIHDALSDQIIYDIRGMIKSFKIKTYDEDTQYGLLRHVLVRRGFTSGQVMVVLVLSSPILPSKNNFVKELRKLHPEISTVIININDKNTSMVLGERNITLYGKGFILDELCGYTFKLSPNSFYQINPVQTEKLYSIAMEYANLTGKEKVIDAYCGIGTIGMVAAKQAKEVIGVELNKSSVRDAINNAKANNVKNIQFFNADAGEFMVDMAEKGETADVVFMDPPRIGSDETFLSSVVKLAPKRIIYVSCNPETLARDLKYLTNNGYEAIKCQPVDMFAFTKHVESVVLLTRCVQN